MLPTVDISFYSLQNLVLLVMGMRFLLVETPTVEADIDRVADWGLLTLAAGY